MKSMKRSHKWTFTSARSALALFATVALATGCLSARAVGITIPGITISDLSDDIPTVKTDFSFVATSEGVSVTGVAPNMPIGTNTVLLTEPAKDPGGPRVSDLVTLTVQGGAAGNVFTLLFKSDGATGFDATLDDLLKLNSTTRVEEDGTLQDLSAALHSGNVTIMVGSDLGGSEVPDAGSTVALLGLSLLVTGAMAQRIRLFRPAL